MDSAPLREFGKITLNENPTDNFTEVEQVNFTPAAIVPGWGLSADPTLQTRLLAYGTAARYRLGVNFHQLPVNKPKHAFNPTKRDGIGYIRSVGRGVPNYIVEDADASPDPIHHEEWRGKIKEHKSKVNDMDNNYKQAKELWDEFKASGMDTIVANVATNLRNATQVVIDRTLSGFKKIDTDLEGKIWQKLVEFGTPEILDGHALSKVGGIIRRGSNGSTWGNIDTRYTSSSSFSHE